MLTRASGPISISGWIILALAVVITGIFVYQDLSLRNARTEVSDNKSVVLFEQMQATLRKKDALLETAEEANIRLQGSIDLRNNIDETARELTKLQRMDVKNITVKKEAIKTKLPVASKAAQESTESTKRSLARISAVWDAYCLTPSPVCEERCS